MLSLTYIFCIRHARLLGTVFITAVFLFPQLVYGQGLVPCEVGCDWDDLIVMVNDVINWLIVIATSVAVLLFTYAGFLYLTSRGDESQVKQATTIFTNVAIGFGIMLIAWLLVTTIVSLLAGEWMGANSGLLPI